MGLVEDLGLSDLTVHQVSDSEADSDLASLAEFPQFAVENSVETALTSDNVSDNAPDQSIKSPTDPIILAGLSTTSNSLSACQIIGLDSPAGGIGVSKFGEILTLYLRSLDYWAETVSTVDDFEQLLASNDYLLLDLPEIIRNQRFSQGLISSANSAANSTPSTALGDRNFPDSAAETQNSRDQLSSTDEAPNQIANLQKLLILVPISTLGLRNSLPWLKSLSDTISAGSSRLTVVLIPTCPNYRFHTRNLTKSEVLTILQKSSIGNWDPDADSAWSISEIYSFHNNILRMAELDQPVAKFPRLYRAIFNHCL
jgi:hypothetical protein